MMKIQEYCETFATTGFVLVGGEITTETYVDVQN